MARSASVLDKSSTVDEVPLVVWSITVARCTEVSVETSSMEDESAGVVLQAESCKV